MAGSLKAEPAPAGQWSQNAVRFAWGTTLATYGPDDAAGMRVCQQLVEPALLSSAWSWDACVRVTCCSASKSCLAGSAERIIYLAVADLPADKLLACR